MRSQRSWIASRTSSSPGERTGTTSSEWPALPATTVWSPSCSHVGPTRREATSTAGQRSTRPPTATGRSKPGCCWTRALGSTSPRAATEGRRSSSPSSGATRETAELLAEHGVVPRNLRAAAGLGRLELIDELVGANGRPAPEAGAHRGFYRPHSGFPAWRPADDGREVLDEALSWAARNDRAEALDLLVARGAAVDADVYRGTALAWAAACGRTGAIRSLLALGADPNARTTFGGPEHGERATALHLAAQDGHLEAIEALLDGGADPTLRDGIYDSPPAGWAEHGGRVAAAKLLRERGG
jgi:hypothetical protein